MTDWKREVGGALMVGLPGPELDRETSGWLRARRPAGVILFGRNLETPRQTAALIEAALPLLRRPALIAVDQEGGRVSRLASWLGPTPSAATLARCGDDVTRRFAAATGRALAALGFNLDFAPVVDLSPPDQPNGIGDRSYGTDPDTVRCRAGAFLAGLQDDAGIAGCLKHFPGLGDTSVDSHVELPVVSRTRAQLDEEDLAPYRALGPIAASVMIGHGHYPALDAESKPASCSPNVVTGLLRGHLGYTGLAVSDDLEMGAVAGRDAEGEAAVLALEAGCDLLLYCSDPARADRALEALAAEARRRPALRNRIAEAVSRAEALAAAWPVRPADVAVWESARADVSSFAARA